MKRNGSEIFFRFDTKKRDLFACFALMRNIEIWSETKMKQCENETKNKRNCRHFRFEAKWSETEAKFFLLRCEIFSLQCEKSVWKWNEAKKTKKKRKLQSEKMDKVKFWDNLFVKSIPSEVKRSEKNVYFVSLLSETKKSEAKWSEIKNFWKKNKAKIICIYFALVGSEKFEAKRS